jgi:hypothetical protein
MVTTTDAVSWNTKSIGDRPIIFIARDDQE